MTTRTFAHLSDLHVGRDPLTDKRAALLRDEVMSARVDHVAVTGDVTHRGRREELERFTQIFRPLLKSGRMTLIPGNHDRLGHQVAKVFMRDQRVTVEQAEGLYLVCLDSTGPHNRSWLASHGVISKRDIEEVVAALKHAPQGALSAVMMHHHPVPLPADHPAEKLSTWMGWQWANELELGNALLHAVRGRCDLVLHGHRHCPREITLFETDRRPVRIFNAGSSTELMDARIFTHTDGRLEHHAWASPENTVLTADWVPTPGLALPLE